MNSLGASIKKVRVSKGLTQSYICNHSHVSQSNYSKFEKGLLDIRASSFIDILDSMDLPLQEFMYIHNQFELSSKESILNKFFGVPFHGIDELKNLQKECRSYLIDHDSSVIKDIFTLTEALIALHKDNNFDKAQKIARPIWNRLSKNDALYLYDLFFLNAILYIFPIESALHIKSLLIKGFKKYEEYPNALPIFLNVYINLSLLFIKNEKYADALEGLELIENLCKKKRLYFQLAIIIIRKGICLTHLNESGFTEIEKGLHLLEAFEEIEVLNIMKEEAKAYAAHPGKMGGCSNP